MTRLVPPFSAHSLGWCEQSISFILLEKISSLLSRLYGVIMHQLYKYFRTFPSDHFVIQLIVSTALNAFYTLLAAKKVERSSRWCMQNFITEDALISTMCWLELLRPVTASSWCIFGTWYSLPLFFRSPSWSYYAMVSNHSNIAILTKGTWCASHIHK